MQVQNNQKKCLILCGDFVEEIDVMIPYFTFQSLGFEVKICSTSSRSNGDLIRTVINEIPYEDEENQLQTTFGLEGHRLRLNLDIKQVNNINWDCLVIPGGRAPEFMRLEQDLVLCIENMMKNKKPIGVIGHGVQMFSVLPDVFKGVRLTGHPLCEIEMKMLGVDFVTSKNWNEIISTENLVSTPSFEGSHKLINCMLSMMGMTMQKPGQDQ